MGMDEIITDWFKETNNWIDSLAQEKGFNRAVDYCERLKEAMVYRKPKAEEPEKTLIQAKISWVDIKIDILTMRNKLTSEEPKKDAINPSHYKQYPVEVIDMMQAIFGVEATINYCVMTAFKYRMRLGHKDDITQELEKEKWYLSKAEELRCKL